MDRNDTFQFPSTPQGVSITPSTNEPGGTEGSPYRFILTTHFSKATLYSIEITVKPKFRPDGTSNTPEHVPGSPFAVMVRPADLSVSNCKPPPESGPGFDTSVAGRGTDFTVVPRDRFDNIRCQDAYGLNDSLVVVVTKDGTDLVDLGKYKPVEWHAASASVPDSPACDVGAQWRVKLPLARSGD